MLSDYNSDAEAPRSTTSSQDLAWLHQQVHRAEQLRTDDPLAIGGRVALEDLFSSEAPNTVPQNLPGQPHQDIANGLRRRHEAEHLQVNDRTRERNLNELLELRNARRRAHRAVARVHDTMNAGAQEEDRLREAEDRAIAAVRRELLLSRTARPRQHARLNRSRDVLRHGIRDAEDGVRRCVDCNWEIEDGICQHW